MEVKVWTNNILCFTSCILLIILCKTTLVVEAAVKLPDGVTFPAVIVFGDSIVDTGNNNMLPTIMKCNFPPYGRDFFGGIPTGRFSDGKVPSDLLVEELGIKELLPAYSDPTLQPNDLLTGVSFASGGSGYDPLTAKLASVISLADQLENFKEYITKLKLIAGEDRTNFILTRAIIGVVAVSNDIANTYFDTKARKAQYDIAGYTDLLVTFASDFYKELYKLGARRIAIFSAPPLGCLPSQITIAGDSGRQCAESINEAAQMYNAKLSFEVDALNRNFSDAKMVYIDVYSPLLDLIQHPDKYGFKEVNEGCCGTGRIEVVVLCNQLDPLTCKDTSNYVFWDSYHPTENAYRILVQQIVQKYISQFY